MSVISIDLPELVSEKLNAIVKDKFEMEKFVAVAVAEKLGYLEDCAARAVLDDFEKILAKIPAVEPEEGDEIR